MRAAIAAPFAAGNQFAAVFARSMIVLSMLRKARFIVDSTSGLEANCDRLVRAELTMGINVHCR